MLDCQQIINFKKDEKEGSLKQARGQKEKEIEYIEQDYDLVGPSLPPSSTRTSQATASKREHAEDVDVSMK